MSKTLKILQLISLLHCRRVVDLETIQKTCHIPERTAYRYLNTISEANIPVYYDKNYRGYCLVSGASFALSQFTRKELTLLVAATRLLANVVPKSQKAQLDRVSEKILVRQPYQIEDLLPELDTLVKELTRDRQFSMTAAAAKQLLSVGSG